MPRTRKLLLTTLVVGATSAVAGLGVFAAFTATTTNTGNSISSGTVAIDDSSRPSGVALYVLPSMGPGSTTQRCIRVTYGGTLASTVKLYRSNTVTQGTAFNLQVERGSGLTGTYPSCTGFAADSPGGTLYNGTLIGFPTTYAAGPDAKGAAWNQNDTVDYRFTITVIDDPTPNSHSTVINSGAHSFTWEARNN